MTGPDYGISGFLRCATRPDCFLSAYDRECDFGRSKWRTELGRGDWHVGLSDGQPVACSASPGTRATRRSQCYLEYLWVVPQARGTGFALSFLLDVLGQLRAAGVRTVLLWVMDGNLPAARLYEKAGFESIGQPVPLDWPGRAVASSFSGWSSPAPPWPWPRR